MTINEEELNTIEDDFDESVEATELPKNDGEMPLAEETDVSVKKKHSIAEVAINIALWIAIAVLLVMVILRLFVFSTVEVEGASMNPTYENAEVVVINKTRLPKRGDVVVFYKNDVDNKFFAQFASREECMPDQPYEKLIKRVVATAGDKIWVRSIRDAGSDTVYEVVIDTAEGNRLYEDYYVKKGEVLPKENYYLHTFSGSGLGNLADCTEENPFVVSKDCIFVMGDNRINSNDSRSFGEVPLAHMFGVVLDK